MNLHMSDDLAKYQIDDIRCQAARRRSQAPRSPGAAPGRPRRQDQRLRHRVGFGLIRAGLYLAAVARPVPND
jgi:hypothetical protein